MTIYDFAGAEKAVYEEISAPESEPLRKDQLFSAVAARLLFFVLFVTDLLWFVWSTSSIAFCGLALLVTGLKVPFFKKRMARAWLSFKRSTICALSLILALFSPPFGIMVACTYFLMYDRAGMDEVIPSSLKVQFKELFRNSENL